MTTTTSKDFVLTRMFDAPRELLWKMWTDPKHAAHWWGPKGVTTYVMKFELKPGGINHYYMDTPDGGKMWGKQGFKEIKAPEKLIFINSFSDEKEGLTRHPMSPSWPLELLTTITFVEKQGKTELTIRWTPINPLAEEQKTFDGAHESMNGGWGGSLDRLTAYLAAL